MRREISKSVKGCLKKLGEDLRVFENTFEGSGKGHVVMTATPVLETLELYHQKLICRTKKNVFTFNNGLLGRFGVFLFFFYSSIY